ncbi:hypothetical protein EVAR_59217_1 [Eumeta japonica]|uniref:Uncharacterized protein n=1 Tax=Eumeta variegata TaxID=151549 RepID=A0A4C1YWM9_EUMVA|nr:hypothetical protein EVAR_59217_1 [Eumeta japonica]
MQVRDGGLMLPHARASSRRGYDPDNPVVMTPFQGSKLEEFPSQPEIKRSCQKSPETVTGRFPFLLPGRRRLAAAGWRKGA